MYLKRQMLGRQCEKRGRARRHVEFVSSHTRPQDSGLVRRIEKQSRRSLACSLDRYSPSSCSMYTLGLRVHACITRARARVSGLTEIKLTGLSEREQGFRS